MLDQKIVERILARLGVRNKILLGKGGEGEVYELNKDSIVKIYGKSNIEYLESLKKFQKILKAHKFSFQTPEIFKIEKLEDTIFTIEKRLAGSNGESLFTSLNDPQRKTLLLNFLDVVDQIRQVELHDKSFGQILTHPKRITTKNWDDYLSKKLDQILGKTKAQLVRDVNNFDEKVITLKDNFRLHLNKCPKKLAHHDYYLNNVLIGDDLEVSAVLDFSPHTVVGDWKMDIAGAVTFLGINPIAIDYIPFMRSTVEEKFGKDMIQIIDLYMMYYSIYYSDTYEFDQSSYQWCVDNLNNERIWDSFSR